VHKIVAAPHANGHAAVEVLTDAGPCVFDRVIVATHSDQALRLLGDATAAERAVLGAIGYQPNTATLHTDERLLPRHPRARASWNYRVDPTARRATVTYWMNNLQRLESRRPLLLTLNGADTIAPERVLAEFEYEHPVFDVAAMRAQRRRRELQGVRGIAFAGAYWGYGFHEDGVQSGIEAADAVRGRR
jgi:predicted NAD/FAD-binding protein